MSGDLLRRHATHGEPEPLKNLLALGANPCSADEHGLTALHYAAFNGSTLCVHILCANDSGRDSAGALRSCIDMPSDMGLTALHLAAEDGVCPEDAIPALLSAGANPSLTDSRGRTPAAAAAEHGRQNCVDLLSSWGGDTAAAVAEHRHRMAALHRVQPERLEPGEQRRRPPPGLVMPEADILPLSRANVDAAHSPTTIKKLQLAAQQADVSYARLKKLAESRDAALMAQVR